MDPEPPSTPTAKAPSVVELQEQHQEALRSASYKASPLHTSTKDLLAEIGLAPKKEISEDELKQGITEALQKCGLAGMTRGKMRVELEGKFETNLADRLGDIGAEMMKQIRNWKKETETVAPPKSVEPKVKAEQAATLVDLTPKEDTITADAAKGGATKTEDVGDTPTTVKAASGLVDSRHKKTKIDEPENNSYGLVFPKNLGSGSNVSVLVELHKPKATLPVDLDGDSGAIGRVSLLDPEGKAHDALEATKGKKRKSIHSWDTEAAARYGKGSKLRLDLKGDVYHGSFLKSNVTMCAVTVTSKHGAKVTGVFNSYVRASFEGNVLEGMRGESVDEK